MASHQWTNEKPKHYAIVSSCSTSRSFWSSITRNSRRIFKHTWRPLSNRFSWLRRLNHLVFSRSRACPAMRSTSWCSARFRTILGANTMICTWKLPRGAKRSKCPPFWGKNLIHSPRVLSLKKSEFSWLRVMRCRWRNYRLGTQNHCGQHCSRRFDPKILRRISICTSTGFWLTWSRVISTSCSNLSNALRKTRKMRSWKKTIRTCSWRRLPLSLFKCVK